MPPPALLARGANTNAVASGSVPSTNSPAVEVPVPVSTFELTTETRDPFFPMSVRQAVATKTTNAAPVFSSSTFTLKGLSGNVGHRLAVVNNRTVAVGEKTEVTTPTGKFIISCEEIRTNSVLLRTESQPDPIEVFLRKSAQ